MIYWRLGWREARNRPGRAILTLLSVVIGVAAVVAVTIATGTTRKAFDQIYRTIAGRASLEVAAPVGTSFDEKILPQIESVTGVEAAAPMIQRRSIIYVNDRRVQVVALGIDPERDKSVHEFKLEEGKFFVEGGGVLLDQAFARNVGAKVGQDVELLTRRGNVKATIAGIYSTGGTATTGQGAALLMSLPAAQYYFKTPRKVDSVQIVVGTAASEKTVQDAIAKNLPEGLSVRPPAARSTMAAETALSTEQGMNMARAFALLVAMFIIANTFLINITQRRRQLGIMRAIGATRSQIARLIYSEALVTGILGTILGSLIGVVAARYLTEAMGMLYDTDLPAAGLSPLPFVFAAIFGIGVSLLGAALPARRASHLQPAEAMRTVLADDIEGVSRMFVVVGSILIAFSVCSLAASIQGWLPMAHSIWSSVGLLTGLVLVMPAALTPLSAAVSSLIGPFLRVEGKLARRQLLRHRSRTALTIGVVFIAVSTGIGLASSVIDNVNDVKNWYRKTIIADFFVRAMAPAMATGLGADLPDGLGDQVRAVPGITNMDAIRFISTNVGDVNAIVVARDYSDPTLQQFDLTEGDPEDVRQKLKDGQIVLGSVLSERTGLKAGDDVKLETKEGEREYRIAAVANDYHAGGLTMFMQREVAKETLGVDGVDAYVVKVDHAKLDEAKAALQKLADENGLLLQSFSDIQHHIDGMMSGVVASLWAMVALGLVVAAFGVANTLTMNVLEQTRELGLLRILAMTRQQVRKMIVAQAIMMGLIALVPGILAGVAVAYLINLATMSIIGHAVAFSIHPLLMAAGLIVGIVIVMGAAWLPAERAARVELNKALSFV